ncbi:MAG: cytidylate kinase family protein, partial [Dehalococcoidia bacterium]
DRVVYHGYAGHLLLRGIPHVLRVRVIANMEFRIKAAMDRNNLSRKEAIELIEKRDDERTKWTRFLYHVDWLDPSLYDLVINLDHITLDSACEAISLAVRSENLNVTPESLKIMDNLALSSEVRARIAAEGKSRDGGIEVDAIDAEDGVVTINGIVHSIEDADVIKEIIHKVSGVKDIRSNLKIRTHW